jgi:hypothetical protein
MLSVLGRLKFILGGPSTSEASWAGSGVTGRDPFDAGDPPDVNF